MKNELVTLDNFDVTTAHKGLSDVFDKIKAAVNIALDGKTIDEFAAELDLRKKSHRQRLTGLARSVSSSKTYVSDACKKHYKVIVDTPKALQRERLKFEAMCDELRDAIAKPAKYFEAAEQKRLDDLENAIFAIKRYRLNHDDGGVYVAGLSINRLREFVALVNNIEITSEKFAEREQEAHEERTAVLNHLQVAITTAEAAEAEAKTAAEAKAKAEQAAKIDQMIGRIRSFGEMSSPLNPSGRITSSMTTLGINQLIETVNSINIADDVYAERTQEAQIEKHKVLETLQSLHQKTAEQEAAQKNADAQAEHAKRMQQLAATVGELKRLGDVNTNYNGLHELQSKLGAIDATIVQLKQCQSNNYAEYQSEAQQAIVTSIESLRNAKARLSVSLEREQAAAAEQQRIEQQRIAEQAAAAEQQRIAAEKAAAEKAAAEKAAAFVNNTQKLAQLAGAIASALENSNDEIARQTVNDDPEYQLLNTDDERQAYINKKLFNKQSATAAAMALAKMLKYSIKVPGLEVKIV